MGLYPSAISAAERNILDGLTATTAELNIMDGVLATAAEINRACDVSTRIVTSNSATLAVTAALHDGKIVNMTKADGQTTTLPAATGSGAKYTFVCGILMSSDNVIKVTTTDIMTGYALFPTLTETTGPMFGTAADSDTITLNGTTSGGLKGGVVRCTDLVSGLWHVECFGGASGAETTPFSAGVS